MIRRGIAFSLTDTAAADDNEGIEEGITVSVFASLAVAVAVAVAEDNEGIEEEDNEGIEDDLMEGCGRTRSLGVLGSSSLIVS